MANVIDLCSDVFATPTDEMWAAMRSAEVGWAYFGQDPSVNRLEALAAETLGKEAALFVQLHHLGVASIHQAGILAAAGIVALTSGITRLADDNRRALTLAQQLRSLPGLQVDLATVQTIIVATDISPSGLTAEAFVARLAEDGVLAYPRPPFRVRFVTHRQIGDAEIERAFQAVATLVGGEASESGGPLVAPGLAG